MLFLKLFRIISHFSDQTNLTIKASKASSMGAHKTVEDTNERGILKSQGILQQDSVAILKDVISKEKLLHIHIHNSI